MHRTDKGKEGERKSACNIFDGLEKMDGSTGFGRTNKKSKLIKSYKGKEDEEGGSLLPMS